MSDVTVAAVIAGNVDNLNKGNSNEGQRTPLYTVYDKQPAYEAQLSDMPEDVIFEKLNRSGKGPEGVYQDIFDYLHFKEMYKPSEQDMNYLDSLILSGADVATTVDIYDFWLTTSEPVSIIGQIYERRGSAPGIYWIEDAFNEVTQYRHGVLDAAGINGYLSERIDAEDIRIANILSRRGVLTITELLDRYEAGEEWTQLLDYVESNAAVIHGGRDTLRISQLETATDLLAAIQFGCIMRESSAPAAEIGGDAENETDRFLDSIRQRSSQVNAKVYTKLLQNGIFVRGTSDGENAQSDAALRQRAVENGLSERTVDALLDEGYQLIEIVNASEECKQDGSTDVQSILNDSRAEQQRWTEVEW